MEHPQMKHPQTKHNQLRTYPVLASLKHSGIQYGPAPKDNEEESELPHQVNMTAKQALPLQKLKVLGEAIEEEEGSEPSDLDKDLTQNPPAALTDEQREAAIREAILNLRNKSDFTNNGKGKPKVESITAITGFDISAKERDTIWEKIEDARDAAEDQRAGIQSGPQLTPASGELTSEGATSYETPLRGQSSETLGSTQEATTTQATSSDD